MIERLMLRASDETAGGADPYAAVNVELILGPLVRPFITLSLSLRLPME